VSQAGAAGAAEEALSSETHTHSAAATHFFLVPDAEFLLLAGGSYDSFGDRVYMKAYRHKLGEQRSERANTRLARSFCSGPWT
jgi:hypothetical protein